MQNINFYTRPSTKYANITYDDACIWADNIADINEKDKTYVPDEFYQIKDIEGVTATDYLFGNSSDLSAYIAQVIWALPHIEELYSEIWNKNFSGYIAFPCDNIPEKYKDRCVHKSKKEILGLKRKYALDAETYEEYIEWFPQIFPDLVFCEASCDHIEKLGTFSAVKEELHRHLCVLNDYAKEIYFEAEKNEVKALATLSAKHNIICSGKGSNEEKEFKICCEDVKITCNPHTKLNSPYSDQRIYFGWGRDEIQNHNIIVARIGNHWTS